MGVTVLPRTIRTSNWGVRPAGPRLRQPDGHAAGPRASGGRKDEPSGSVSVPSRIRTCAGPAVRARARALPSGTQAVPLAEPPAGQADRRCRTWSAGNKCTQGPPNGARSARRPPDRAGQAADWKRPAGGLGRKTQNCPPCPALHGSGLAHAARVAESADISVFSTSRRA